ncbi:hypothetical protein A2Y83_03875 [Candidatus Falkowbacteria bacterium RBG_13_39_14]|uniref:Helicase C-terminal domain-containing protein n=1 Tax=Candidatus Falkowbacteria bacterium RBG_13_39_14 TaxID=1797985 RepID=A0A1F5S7S1_9BACT|nr:MAG: hypothetical protein A2Y83_03875 [Candidatus Falkowbacteria bacterium RBG_13_39_14]
MIQTLNRMDDIERISDKFGLILVDECHHLPAKMFRDVIIKFSPYYLYGLTATPKRKNNDEKLIFFHLGDILHTIDKNFREEDNNSVKNKKIRVVIRNTEIEVPFKVKTDNAQILLKIIAFDSGRNKKITEDIMTELKSGSKCLVLTERKEHAEILGYYLKREYEAIILTGDLTEKQRKEKIRQIEDGNFQVILATGQLIGEGTDFHGINSLFLVFPFAFQGKLTQYIGRIQRDAEGDNIIYDYRDIKIDYLEKFFKKRMNYYKKNFEEIEV